MTAVTITELEPAPRFGPGVAGSPWTVRDEAPEPEARPLPMQGVAPAPPSWERILVNAGLDRESRELAPAERWLADRSVGAV